MKLLSFLHINSRLYFILSFFCLGCDGLIRGEEKILIREKSGLLKEYEGDCLVSLFSKSSHGKGKSLHQTGVKVKKGNLEYFFTVSPFSKVYIKEIECTGGIQSSKEIHFPENAKSNFEDYLIIRELQ